LAGCNHSLDAFIQKAPIILAKRFFLADIEVVLDLVKHIIWEPVLIEYQLLKNHSIRLYYVSNVNDCGHILNLFRLSGE
jgi:hypothetical protein